MGMFLNGAQALSGAGINMRSHYGLENCDLFNAPFYWDSEMRSPRMTRTGYGWDCLWPSSAMQLGGDASAGGILGDSGASINNTYEPWSLGETGTIRQYYFRGLVTDSVGGAVGGVTVKCYLTVGDIEVNSVGADSNGNYVLGTQYLSSQHYLVAYDASGNRAGTTVNTLTPSP